MGRMLLLLGDDSSPITSTYIRRVQANGGSLSQQEISAYRDLENDLRRAGLVTDNKTTSPIKRLNMFTGDSLAAALVPFIAYAGFNTDRNNGITSSEYTRNGGLRSLIASPARYLATGYSPLTNSTVDNRFCGVWEFAKGSSPYAVSVGSCDDVNKAYNLLNLSGSTDSYQFLYDNGSEASIFPYTESSCFWIGARVSNKALLYKNGAIVFDDIPILTQPLTSNETYIFALNVAGEAQYLSDVRLGAYILGFDINSTKASLLYNALSKFNTSLSRV